MVCHCSPIRPSRRLNSLKDADSEGGCAFTDAKEYANFVEKSAAILHLDKKTTLKKKKQIWPNLFLAGTEKLQIP